MTQKAVSVRIGPVEKEHVIAAPLDYKKAKGPKIQVYAKEVFLPGNEKKDIFVFLQGGPGFASPRDLGAYAWIQELLKTHRILFLDQRGTGKSTKIGPELVKMYKGAKELAYYFSCHRADSIVADLELIRKTRFKNQKWFLLGQSYGGFVSFTYLSKHPEALKGVITTGGCPPLTVHSADVIYERILENVYKRSMEFYKRYPQDILKVKKIVNILKKKPVKLPDGGIFSPDRFLDIGLGILGSERNLERMHAFLDDPFIDNQEKKLSYEFISQCTSLMSYEAHPIFSVLHESIYMEGKASKWAAHRGIKNNKKFSLKADRIVFRGENIRKEMFEEYALLRPFKKAAQILAEKKDWAPLYSLKALKMNPVPVECLIMAEDFYVDRRFSLETVKATKNAQAFIHEQWQHDALRVHGQKVIETLLSRLKKRVINT